MSRRKPIDAKILEASKEFNAQVFAETVKREFIAKLHAREKTTLSSTLQLFGSEGLEIFALGGVI